MTSPTTETETTAAAAPAAAAMTTTSSAEESPPSSSSSLVPPSPAPPSEASSELAAACPTKRRRLLFGSVVSVPSGDDDDSAAGRRSASFAASSAVSAASPSWGRPIYVPPTVRRAYSAMSRRNGSLGGNGSGGAIYGELTMGSMQRMVDLLKVYARLDAGSRFLDVGCGLGKPCVHVAIDPGVAFSYGVEMEGVRWRLGMSNLDAVLGMSGGGAEGGGKGMEMSKCLLAHADITDAETLDPFTHIYMFDTGFPPALFYALSAMFNASRTPLYLACFHGPRLMVDEYGFDVEVLVRARTSMHGSKEVHMGYVYRRRGGHEEEGADNGGGGEWQMAEAPPLPCDPLFRSDYDLVRTRARGELAEHVRAIVRGTLDDPPGGAERCGGGGAGDGGEGDGTRRSGRERRPPKKFAIEG